MLKLGLQLLPPLFFLSLFTMHVSALPLVMPLSPCHSYLSLLILNISLLRLLDDTENNNNNNNNNIWLAGVVSWTLQVC